MLSVVSLVVGIGAIIQGFVFYRWSEEASRKTRESAQSIEASINKIEVLFNTMYSTTFAALNEANTAIREHAFQKTVDNEELRKKVSEMIYHLGIKEDADRLSRELLSGITRSVVETMPSTFPTSHSRVPYKIMPLKPAYQAGKNGVVAPAAVKRPEFLPLKKRDPDAS